MIPFPTHSQTLRFGPLASLCFAVNACSPYVPIGGDTSGTTGSSRNETTGSAMLGSGGGTVADATTGSGGDAASNVTSGSGGADASTGSGRFGGGGATAATCAGSDAYLADAPWPTAGGCSSRQGRSRYSAAASLEIKWSVNDDETGEWRAGYAPPSLATNGTLYVGSTAGRVAAFTPAGEREWAFAIDKTAHFGSTTATLAPNGDLYAGSSNFAAVGDPWESALYSLDAQGDLQWSFGPTGATVAHAVLDSDGSIYFTAYSHLYAMSSEGDERWDLDLGAALGSPSLGADGTIYVGCADESLYAIAAGGTVKWSVATGQDVTFRSAPPVVADDGTVYVTTYDKQVFAISPEGSLDWQYSVGSGPPYILAGEMVALGHDGTVYLSDHSALHAIDPNGALAWSQPDVPAMSSPVVAANGNVLVTTIDGRLCEVIPTGSVERCVQVVNDPEGWFSLYASPVIGADGTVYVVAWSHGVYALGM